MPNEVCKGCKIRGNTVLRGDGFWHLSCFRKHKAKVLGPDMERKNRLAKQLRDERFVQDGNGAYWIHLDDPSRKAKIVPDKIRGPRIAYL